MTAKFVQDATSTRNANDQAGFSLLEVIIALLILLIAVLGIFAAFTYSITYNSGNSRRSQALSVFQQEIEILRSSKFTPTITDPALVGGAKAAVTRTAADNTRYLLEVTVDDDPFTDGTQVNTTTTLKEIRLRVTPEGQNGTWITAYRTAMVLRRVRAN